MIPLVPLAQNAAASLTGSWSLSALWRDMLRAWIAHHQRMADLGLHGGL